MHSVLEALPYYEYALHPEIRGQLIPKKLLTELKTSSHWNAAHFQRLRKIHNEADMSSWMKQAILSHSGFAPETLGLSLHETNNTTPLYKPFPAEWTISKRDCSAQAGSLKLLPAGAEFRHHSLALYNKHKTNSVEIDAEGKRHTLKPGEGLILQSQEKADGEVQWNPVAHYQHNLRWINSNPLIRDEGPTISPHKYLEREMFVPEGEYFLTPNMVQQLVMLKSRGLDIPEICQEKEDFIRVLKDFSASDIDYCPCKTILTWSDKSNHIVAIRLLRKKNDELLVYLHETLGPESLAAKDIREELLSAIQEIKPAKHISFLTPGFTSQRDFSSCGVFALKAHTAFSKHPELDDWLWQQAGQQKTMLHHSGSVSRLKNHLISLHNMPAQLLKQYQGKESLSPEQINRIVSGDNIRLQDYFTRHQPVNSDKPFNLSAIGKKYKYLSKLPGMRENYQHINKERSQLENQLKQYFKPILAAQNVAVANQWLKDKGHRNVKVSAHDWDMCCVFEDFVFRKKTVTKIELNQLRDWLNSALNITGQDEHRNRCARDMLVQAWCLFMRDAEDSRFKNRSLPVILRCIERQLQGAELIKRSTSVQTGASPKAKRGRPRRTLSL